MKRYIVKKYINADSIADALKRERKSRPDEIWLDEKQPESPATADVIGFHYAVPEDK